jgi:hypothetical protein
MLLFCISIIDRVDISSSKRFHDDSNHEFGFVDGATAQISVSNVVGSLIVGLLTSDSLSFLLRTSIDPISYCSLKSVFSDQQRGGNSSSFTFSTTIRQRDSYIPFFFACNSESYRLQVEYFFYNVNGHLDYHWDLVQISYPIFIALFLLCLVGWLFNYVMDCTLPYPLHWFITASCTLTTLSKICSFVTLEYMDAHGFVSPRLGIAEVVVQQLSRAVLFCTILLTANGWYIIKSTIGKWDVGPGMMSIVLFCICKGLLDYTDDWSARSQVLLVAFAVVGLFTFVHAVSRSVKTTSVAVSAHFNAVQSAGVDPKSIPAWRKFEGIAAYYKLLTLYLVSCLCAVVFDLFLLMLLWLSPFIYGLIDLLVCAALAWLMRLRPGTLGNYLILDEEHAVTIAPVVPSLPDEISDEPAPEEPAQEKPAPDSAVQSDHASVPDNPYDDQVL